MSRGELAIVIGVVLCAIGAGLFHPGAGLLVAGVAAAAYGVLELRFPDPDEEAEPAAVDESERRAA